MSEQHYKDFSVTKELLNDEAPNIICPYCTAVFSIHLPTCPYCDSPNEYGMEEQYIKDVSKLNESLEDMKDYAREEYHREIKGIWKVLLIMIIILLILAGGVLFLIEYGKYDYERDLKKTYEWEDANYPKLDALYEEGDYEGIKEFFYSTYDSGNEYAVLYEWSHYDFIQAYINHSTFDLWIEYRDYDSDSAITSRESLFIDVMFLMCEDWDTKLKINRITKKEYAIISDYRSDARELMEEYFGITDLEAVAKRCSMDPPGIGIDYTKTKKTANEYEWIK